ncbi:hypothetical protein GmHk_18G053550 [Glycine max]|nr:hypothetical protein GmHk_18G053550 [Glycine max]
MPNWELRNCCDHDQKVFIACVAAFTVVILVLWRTFLLTPFKLITVFLHEASHAIACWLTCGKVEGIQVHANEGGVTQTRGGIYWVILPAGYLGSSFWGMALILASTNLLTAKIAAGCFIAALIVVLFLAKNVRLVMDADVLYQIYQSYFCPDFSPFSCLATHFCSKSGPSEDSVLVRFIVFIAVIWLLQEKTTVHVLRYVILFIDIYDDLISRRVHSSDAEKFAEVCPCPCNGFGWGVIWGMISFAFLCASLYLGLVILSVAWEGKVENVVSKRFGTAKSLTFLF